jgi:hypothetical protein
MGTPNLYEQEPSPPSTSSSSSSQSSSPPSKVAKLSQTSIHIIRHSIGCTNDPESSALIHTTSNFYPPRGLPPGLYKSIILSRTISQYQYILSTLFFNFSLVLQVILGAAVTAIGSSDRHGVAVTILAAANTVNAGLLALMHNSGLPDRYKNDWNVLEELEMWIWKVVETGVLEMTGRGEDGWDAQEVVHECFERYAEVKKTIAKNKPAAYLPTTAKEVTGKAKKKKG